MWNRSCRQYWPVLEERPSDAGHRDARPVAAHAARASLWLRLPARAVSVALILLIQLYRVAVSPLLGRNCRFHPTCSAYAVEALRQFGPLRGTSRSITRLARCHPLSEGGYDPVR